MAAHKEPWNLTDDGLPNIAESLKNKLNAASFRLECGGGNTIINIDSYECTVLIWALQKLRKKG